MMTCKEFARLVSSSVGKLGWWKSRQVARHRKACPDCRNYAQQIGGINDTAKDINRDALRHSTVDLEEVRQKILQKERERQSSD